MLKRNIPTASLMQATLSPTSGNTYAALLVTLNYWNNEQKFVGAVRLLNKKLRDHVAKQITGPYTSKIDFVMANTGIYHTKAAAMEAVRVYQNTVYSTSTLPAVFYALSERSLLQSTLFTEPDFTRGEDIYQMGRVYCPIKHNWVINAAWVLAQLHKGRRIQVMTPYPVGDNTHRPGGDYSALTKEIATAFKAGYTIMEIKFKQDGRPIVHLGPAADLDHSPVLSFSIRDLILTNEDCQFAISSMRDTVALRLAVGRTTNNLFALLLTLSSDEKKQFMQSYYDMQRSNINIKDDSINNIVILDVKKISPISLFSRPESIYRMDVDSQYNTMKLNTITSK